MFLGLMIEKPFVDHVFVFRCVLSIAKRIILEGSDKDITISETIITILTTFFHVFHLALVIISVWILHFPVSEVPIFKCPFENPFLLFPNSLTMRLIIFEFAFIDITIWVLKDTFLRHSMVKNTIKNTAVWILHYSFSMMPALIVTFTLIKSFSLMQFWWSCLILRRNRFGLI